ncbi:NAD(P)H-dependent oxidoreductase subunit E [bacterium]|nr:NAD(P)H-dependent oxidoreductase subunit E [bacterium]
MANDKIAKMRDAHKVLAELKYEPAELNRGYTNKTLRIDISNNSIEILPVTQQMKDLWTGGKGFDLWLMFQEINKDTKWNSPENTICFSQGPLGGTTSFPGSGKTIVTSLSPLTHSIIDSNVGGYFGPYLKFVGFDALSIVGKAKDDIMVVIDGVNKKITIESAPLEDKDTHLLAEELTEMYADDIDDRRNIAIVSSGAAAEHVKMGVLNFSFYDWRRNVLRVKQAGRGGTGRVFRDKGLKALVIKKPRFKPNWTVQKNKVADEFEKQICKNCGGEKELENIEQTIAIWNNDPEYVIEMMQDVQDKNRYISESAIDEICSKTNVPRAVLYHIATFYKAFSLAPRGETVIQVCVGTTCHVKGSAKILSEFERELGIEQGQTTPDGKFSIEGVACLGACSIAPVIAVNGKVHGNFKMADIKKIIQGSEGGAK